MTKLLWVLLIAAAVTAAATRFLIRNALPLSFATEKAAKSERSGVISIGT